MIIVVLGMRIEIIRGDITEVDCEAIVNPANSLMIMGGGVALVIKRKGGEIIEKEAKRYAPVSVGNAIVTTAGSLKAKYVIHAPTMERPAMRTTADKVKKAIKAALQRAAKLNVRCVAFPGMGTGVGGLSPEGFASVFLEALSELREILDKSSLEKIILVAYTQDLYEELTKIEEKLNMLWR